MLSSWRVRELAVDGGCQHNHLYRSSIKQSEGPRSLLIEMEGINVTISAGQMLSIRGAWGARWWIWRVPMWPSLSIECYAIKGLKEPIDRDGRCQCSHLCWLAIKWLKGKRSPLMEMEGANTIIFVGWMLNNWRAREAHWWSCRVPIQPSLLARC